MHYLGTPMGGLSLYQIVEKVHKEPHNALLYFYTSQAWNMDFFLQGLSEQPTSPTNQLLLMIERDFGSLEKLKGLVYLIIFTRI